MRNNETENSGATAAVETKFVEFFDKLVDLLDMDEFMSLFGWLLKELIEQDKSFRKQFIYDPWSSTSSNATNDKLFLIYKNKNNSNSNASRRIAALYNRNNLERKNVISFK